MGTSRKVKHDLFHHFEQRGVVAGHIVRLGDFTQNMTAGYTPQEKAGIAAAFAELVAAGVLEAKSDNEYLLSPRGLELLREDRIHEVM